MQISRRNFIKLSGLAGATIIAGGSLAACSTGSGSASTSASASASASASGVAKPDKLYMEWLPSESTADYEQMRDEFSNSIAQGAGVPCETLTATDMNVVVEAICAGKTHYAYLGAAEYINAHEKNPSVQPAWVLSDKEGKLNKVTYHSQVLCREEDADKYKKGDTYELSDVKGINYAFVSPGSTSGFVLPATIYMNKFGLSSTDDIAESDKYLGTVTMAGSHALALYTLLTGDADLCSCDDTGTSNYYDVVEGTNGEVGAVYEVKKDLDSPFDTLAGQRVVCVASYAAPGAPFVVNVDVVPEDMNQDVIDYMCSDAVSDNPKLFTAPDDTTTVSKWKRSTDEISFVPLDDSYYDDFRKLLSGE